MKAAANAPVSEFESPKLKIAGNPQFSNSLISTVAKVAESIQKENRIAIDVPAGKYSSILERKVVQNKTLAALHDEKLMTKGKSLV